MPNINIRAHKTPGWWCSTCKSAQEIPDWQFVQLEKPCGGWDLDQPETYYDVFGDQWFVRLYITVISIHWRFLPGQEQDFSLGDAMLVTTSCIPLTQPLVWEWTWGIRCVDVYCSRPSARPVDLYYARSPWHILPWCLLPPSLDLEEPPEWQRRVDWISKLATNLMAAVNDLRLVQVICASNEHIGKRKPGVTDASPARTS